jgi:hypothetical protein
MIIKGQKSLCVLKISLEMLYLDFLTVEISYFSNIPDIPLIWLDWGLKVRKWEQLKFAGPYI